MLRFMLAPLLIGSSVTYEGQKASKEYIKRLELSGIVCHILIYVLVLFTANFHGLKMCQLG